MSEDAVVVLQLTKNEAAVLSETFWYIEDIGSELTPTESEIWSRLQTLLNDLESE